MADRETSNLEEILRLFSRTCPSPSDKEIAAWQAQWPQAAEAISRRAAEIAFRAGLPTYDELIETSGMSDERKAYWLRDD